MKNKTEEETMVLPTEECPKCKGEIWAYRVQPDEFWISCQNDKCEWETDCYPTAVLSLEAYYDIKVPGWKNAIDETPIYNIKLSKLQIDCIAGMMDGMLSNGLVGPLQKTINGILKKMDVK